LNKCISTKIVREAYNYKEGKAMISDLYAFPPEKDAQSDELVKQLIMAHRRLAELKGVAHW
jgi:hypothetical protein